MSTDLHTLPASEADLDKLTKQCRSFVNKQALLSSTTNLVPIPMADIAVDVGLMTRILNHVNKSFGLSEEQIADLTSREQQAIALLIAKQGASYAGKTLSKALVTNLLRTQASKLTSKQVAKLVPFVGQAIACSISYMTLRYVGNSHINKCRSIVQELRGWEQDADRKARLAAAQAAATSARRAAESKQQQGLVMQLRRRVGYIGEGIRKAIRGDGNTP